MKRPTRRSATSQPDEFEETPVTMVETSEQIGTEPQANDRRVLIDRVPALRPLSPVPTYVGLAVTITGFVLIAIAWSKTAALDNVALQVPYLISAGLTGLALVIVGVATVSIAARRRDAVLREQQTALLADALRELGAAMDPDRR